MNVDKLKIEVIIKIQRRYWKGVSMNEIKENSYVRIYRRTKENRV